MKRNTHKSIVAFFSRCGVSVAYLARKLGVPAHRIRSIVATRKGTDVGRERDELVERVAAELPPDEGSSWRTMAATAQAGSLGDVVLSLRERQKELERKNEEQLEHIKRLEKRLDEHHTPSTTKLSVVPGKKRFR